MAKQKKQRFEGIVYSTANDFSYTDADPQDSEQETLSPNKQHLKVMLDRKARKGKVVTIVQGFIGNENDLNNLAKKIKQKCGVGGGAKEGDILIQGDFKAKVSELLKSEGYAVKLVGG
ncbi:MAG: translation initiation factor [Sphingobacterium sp.]|uniref:translation initiation factor n=1 Tax=Sphingobacterium sp. JB170 TaxID=1434842 RepID=UPI00097F03B4|nr:translation initiation factor [Sphingobacterium sp. JB170]SJN43051.1 Translation initiation factor SUI1-related protein [Sphingobacterium sp. JB170]